MTALGLLVLVAGVGLIYAAVTDQDPLGELKAALSGSPSPAAKPVKAQPATAG